MKKYISVFILFIAATTMAALISKFRGWNELVDRSPDIVIARCTSTLGTTKREKMIVLVGGAIPSDIQVISVLKGNTKPGKSHMMSTYWPYPDQEFLLFARYLNDQTFTGYMASEDYEIVPLNHDFNTNMLAGKTPEQQIQWILDRRLHDLNEELVKGNEERKRLEEGLKTPTASKANP